MGTMTTFEHLMIGPSLLRTVTTFASKTYIICGPHFCIRFALVILVVPFIGCTPTTDTSIAPSPENAEVERADTSPRESFQPNPLELDRLMIRRFVVFLT